jgi:uncharacterized membrane protein
MARTTILFGFLLILLGVAVYAAAVTRGTYWHAEGGLAFLAPGQRAEDDGRPESVRALTSLIPAGFGLVFVVLGLIALSGSESTRKHTMHAAALLGLVGIVLPGWRLFKGVTGANPPDGLAINGLFWMVGLCVIFLALCIKSFVDARIARQRQQDKGQDPAIPPPA